jgi:hypothetical protein
MLKTRGWLSRVLREARESQRTRVVNASYLTPGWRDDSRFVEITRPGRWGNPFRGRDAVARFEAECSHLREEAQERLRGKILVCAGRRHSPCHGDVLAKWADG